MSRISCKIVELGKKLGIEPIGEYSHWDVRTGAPMHIRRYISEMEYALYLSETQSGKWDLLLEEAADFALAAVEKDGTLTKENVEKAEAILEPMKAAARKYTVHMVAHAHIDMNWMWPWQETVSVTLETFRTVLRLMEEYPDFTYSQSQASTYRIVETYEPEMLEEIKKRIREGRWEVSASTWVEADKNMPNEESMARHLLYTKQYLSKLLEIDPSTLDLDFEPDTFGHSANVPDILSRGGVKHYYHCRGYEGDPIYRWQAPSGREVLVFCEPTWYLGDINPAFAKFVPAFCEKYGLTDSIKVYGVGDHGGGPTRRDLNFILEMQKWPIWPELRFSTYKAFFNALEEKRDTYPIVSRELNFVFTGCYTTQGRIKAANRHGEARLSEAETLSAMAGIYTGRKPRTEVLKDAWKKVLFSQFHDILPGSCKRDSREYALGTFQEVTAVTGTQSAAAIRVFSEAVDTSSVQEKGDIGSSTAEGAGVGYGAEQYQPAVPERGVSLTRIFHLYNASSLTSSVPVEIELWDYPGDLSLLKARELAGASVPLQVISSPVNWSGHMLVRVLLDIAVPAFGWNTVVLEENDELRPLKYPCDPRVHIAPKFVLENEYIRAGFDNVTGAMISLIDKQTGLEMLSAPAGFMDILEDSDAGMSAWIVGRYKKRELVSKNVRIENGVNGTLRNSVVYNADFGGNHVKAEICLDKGSKFLKYSVNVDWNDLGSPDYGIPQLAFSVPCARIFDDVLYDIPSGLITRKPMALDVPAQSFAAPVSGDGGVGVVLAGDSKYGFRADNGYIQMTLVRNPFEPDTAPDRGMHTFEIYLGTARPENAATSARTMLTRIRNACMRPHTGKLPASGSLLSTGDEKLRVNQLKPAEDGNGWILRIVNPGEERNCEIKCAVDLAKVTLCDVLEHDLEQAEIIPGGFRFTAEAYGLMTLRLVP